MIKLGIIKTLFSVSHNSFKVILSVGIYDGIKGLTSI